MTPRKSSHTTTHTPNANEKALAKLLREYEDQFDADEVVSTRRERMDSCDIVAAYLARRGVLAVNARTVPNYRGNPDGSCAAIGEEYTLRAWLRRLARGA